MKKVRNSLTWFSHGSGAASALVPLGRVKDRKLYFFACDMWISLETWCLLVCLSSGEAWKLFSRASVKGLLLGSGILVHGSISDDRGLDSSPASPHGSSVEDIERAVASEWTRVEDTYGLERPLHGENLGIFRLWLSPVETCLGMYDCVSLISGYWAIYWRRWTERVRTVSPSRLTSVPAIVFCLVVGVGFCCWLVSSCFGSSCVVVSLFSLCTIRSVIHKL